MIIDLAKAQFFASSPSNWRNQYGQYDLTQQVIYGRTGWPDFFIPYALDPMVTYTIRYKYDAGSSHDSGGRGLWITALRPGFIDSDYRMAPHFGEIYNNTSPNSSLADVTITVGPGINTGTHGGWDGSLGPVAGYVIPWFETNHIGAFSYLEITPDPTPVAPTPWPAGEQQLVSGHNQQPIPADAGTEQPYFPVYWRYTPDTTQSLTLDAWSTLVRRSGADSFLYVFRGPDFEEPNFVILNDDGTAPAPSDFLSNLTFTALAGVDYHIRLGSYDTSGDAILTYDLNAPFIGENLAVPSGPPPPPPPGSQDAGDTFFTRRGSFW